MKDDAQQVGTLMRNQLTRGRPSLLANSDKLKSEDDEYVSKLLNSFRQLKLQLLSHIIE